MFSSRVTRKISKLRAGGRLTAGPAPEPEVEPVGIEGVIRGEELVTPIGKVFLSRRKFSSITREASSWAGKYSELGSKLLGEGSCRSSDWGHLAGEGWKKAVFMDLETGGLSGGPVFLGGLFYWMESGFFLEQLFARDYSEERPLLEELAKRIRKFDCLITYNGKSYDLPFLKDRLVYHGLPVELDMPHIDLLHHVRRRWKRKLPDCKLKTLEWHLCNRFRSGDVPGEEIPGVYHEFVRTGDPYALVAVFHHNALDVVTMGEIVLKLGLEEETEDCCF